MLLFPFYLYSQDTLKISDIEKQRIWLEDEHEMFKARCEDRYIVIYDTLGFDSVIQILYSNNQVYYQNSYINGCRTKWHERFYPNGQIMFRWNNDIDSLFHNGYPVVYFDRFGDTLRVEQWIIFRHRPYLSEKRYFYGVENLTFYYRHDKKYSVEYFRQKGEQKWVYIKYFRLSFRYPKRLLKQYLKATSSSCPFKQWFMLKSIRM
jgi:hypothetical protein